MHVVKATHVVATPTSPVASGDESVHLVGKPIQNEDQNLVRREVNHREIWLDPEAAATLDKLALSGKYTITVSNENATKEDMERMFAEAPRAK